jgi:hypothetical protein
MNKLCETGDKRKMPPTLQQFQYRRPAIPPEEANAEGKWRWFRCSRSHG